MVNVAVKRGRPRDHRRAAWCAGAVSLAGACGGAAASPDPPPSVAAWSAARARLAELRLAASPPVARTQRLALTLREPVSGRELRARGAVAVAPPSSLRMILLGPGGTTALDLWMADERFRFAVPAIGLLERGDARTPRAAKRGLPVDFLRWWLLRPLSGTLLFHKREANGDRFVLRDGQAIVDVDVKDDGRVRATRSTFSGHPARRDDEETVTATRMGCADASYRQASTGLVAHVRCEAEQTSSTPSPRAFEDPDAGPGR
jgi:hypothetical protein